MGLSNTIQSLVGTAFAAIGDLAETVDYIHEGQEPDYNTTTGQVASDPATVTLPVRAMFKAFKKDDKDLPTELVEVGLPGDQVVLVPGVDVTISPTTGDKIVRIDDTWLVKGFARDPAKGLWKFVVGRVGGGAEGRLVFHDD